MFSTSLGCLFRFFCSLNRPLRFCVVISLWLPEHLWRYHFVTCPSCWVLSWCFPVVRFKLCGFGRNVTELMMMGLSHGIWSGWHVMMVHYWGYYFDHWIKLESARLLTVKWLFPSDIWSSLNFHPLVWYPLLILAESIIIVLLSNDGFSKSIIASRFVVFYAVSKSLFLSTFILSFISLIYIRMFYVIDHQSLSVFILLPIVPLPD